MGNGTKGISSAGKIIGVVLAFFSCLAFVGGFLFSAGNLLWAPRLTTAGELNQIKSENKERDRRIDRISSATEKLVDSTNKLISEISSERGRREERERREGATSQPYK